jgi:tetratricopeptide (TPR) repeat protein
LEEARQVLTTEVIPVAEATGDLWTLIDALTNLGWVSQLLGEYILARASQERGLVLAERIGGRAQMAHLTFGHGLTAFFLDDWKQARDDFEQTACLAVSAGWFWSSAYGLGLLALAQGQEEARGALEEVVMLAEQNHDLPVYCLAQGTLAEDDLLAGRKASASTRLATFIRPPNEENIFVKWYLPLLAWAELEMGEVTQAQARLEEVIALARQEGMRPLLAEALRVQAVAWSRQERWAEAEAALEEALALCRAMVTPYAEAKTLSVAGRLSQARGEPEQACERLEAALMRLRKLGERMYACRIEQALAVLKHYQARAQAGRSKRRQA